MSDRQKTTKNDCLVSTIVDHHGSTPASVVARRSLFVMGFSVLTLAFVPACGQQTRPPADSHALYRQAGAPIEQRVADLLGRMTLEEKVRQLDLYSGATALVDQHTDSTHAAAPAVFRPDKAQGLWGDLGVGGIHDLNPTPQQANAIQTWVIEQIVLAFPRCSSKRACMASTRERYFPPLSISPQPGIRILHKEQAVPSQPRHERPVWT